MNSNEETLLKSHLTEKQFKTLKQSEETVKQLKTSTNPANRKRVEMLYNLISTLKTRPVVNNSLKKHENNSKSTSNNLKNYFKENITRKQRNIKNLTNKKNRYSSLSSAPTMKNKFSSMFGFTKSSNLTNLSKTMKNRMSQSNTSVNKRNKELQNKKNSLQFSKNMSNTLIKLNTSRKERNKEMNLITQMVNTKNRQTQQNLNNAVKNSKKGVERSKEAVERSKEAF
jgi:hypothetical protein